MNFNYSETTVKEALYALFNSFTDSFNSETKLKLPDDVKQNPIITQMSDFSYDTIVSCFGESKTFGIFALSEIVKDKPRLSTEAGCKLFLDCLKAISSSHKDDEHVREAAKTHLANKYYPPEYPFASDIIFEIYRITGEPLVIGSYKLPLNMMLCSAIGTFVVEELANEKRQQDVVSVFERFKDLSDNPKFFFHDLGEVIGMTMKPRIAFDSSQTMDPFKYIRADERSFETALRFMLESNGKRKPQQLDLFNQPPKQSGSPKKLTQ